MSYLHIPCICQVSIRLIVIILISMSVALVTDSVQLARRLLQVERANTSLRKSLENENKKSQQLASQVDSTNRLLKEAQQPYSYLIDSLQGKDNMVQNQKQLIESLEEDVR